MAREIGSSIIIDPFNGQDAIRRRMIESVGRAEDRFREDALRIIRAIRFSCQLGFEISHETTDTIQKFAIKDFWSVSPERIQSELVKAFSADTAKSLMYLGKFPHLIGLFSEKNLWLKPTLEVP